MRRRVWVFSIPGCLDNPTRLNSETRLMGSRPCIIGLNVRSHELTPDVSRASPISNARRDKVKTWQNLVSAEV
jgi:hypothetical protein